MFNFSWLLNDERNLIHFMKPLNFKFEEDTTKM